MGSDYWLILNIYSCLDRCFRFETISEVNKRCFPYETFKYLKNVALWVESFSLPTILQLKPPSRECMTELLR